MRSIRVAELSSEQKDDLHELYLNEWWTSDRERDEVDSVVENSDEVFAFCEPDTGTLVAFARVLTDYTYKAFVFDVIVAPGYRGTGLGVRLIDAILDDPALASVRHFELYCLDDLVEFYERWGFSDELGDLRLMRHER